MAGGIFEDQDVAAPQGGISPQQAVPQAPSTAMAVGVSAAQGLGNLLSSGIQIYQNKQKAQQQAKEDAGVTNYSLLATKLNAGVAQGSISQADAQRQLRAAFNQTIANNPHLTEKLIGVNSALAGSAGLGDVLAKGTAADQAKQEGIKSATTAGFITSGMTPEQQEAGYGRWQAQQAALNQMNFASKQLELQNQQLALTEKRANIANAAAQRANALQDLQIKRNVQAVRNGMADVTNVYAQDTLHKVGMLQDQLKNKQITPEQFLQATQEMRNKFYSTTQSARGVAGGDYVDTLASPLFKMLDAADNQASGKVDTQVAQNQLEHASVTAQLDLMKNPTLARIAAQSKMFNGIFNPQVLSRFGDDVVNVLKKNSGTGQPANPVPDTPEEMETHSTYLDGLKEGIKTLTSKNPAAGDLKGLQDELETNLNQTLKGVGVMGASTDSPTQFNNVMKFFSDPSFLDFQKNGGKIDPSLAQNVKNIIQENYQSQLIPAVRTAWEQAQTVTATGRTGSPVQVMGGIGGGYPSTEATPKTVEYRWTGQSLQFVPAKGLERNAGAMAKAKELNRKVSPLVQRLVMADAHLEGNQDYSKYFKELEPAIFGQKEEGASGQ